MALLVPVDKIILNKLFWPEQFATFYAKVPSRGNTVSLLST